MQFPIFSILSGPPSPSMMRAAVSASASFFASALFPERIWDFTAAALAARSITS